MGEQMTEKTIEKPKEQHRKTNLQTLGNNFPILTFDGPTQKFRAKRSFSFLEWDMGIEEKIAEYKAKSKTVGEFVSKIFSILLDDFCGIDFQKQSPEQRLLLINQLEIPNVMYAYLCLRIEELGHELRMDVPCPHCKKMNKDWRGDLRTIEIGVKDEEHQRKVLYDLVKPIRMGDEKTVVEFELDVPKWDAMENVSMEVAENEAKFKREIFKSSIVSFKLGDAKDASFTDKDEVISKLKKVDIEKCMKVALENAAGPIMSIGGKCTHCSTEWVKPLNWGYDYFFDSSSL